MAKMLKWRNALGIAAALSFLAAAAGCGSGKEEIYPLAVDGTEIVLDQTAMQTIYDAGFEVSVMDTSTGSIQWYEVEPDMPLDVDSIYTEIYIGKGGEPYAVVGVVTEEACAVKNGVIYSFTSAEGGLDKISISSVPLTDLTEEKALEIEEKLEANGYYQSCVTESKILRITRENGATGAVTKLEVEVRYDIEDTK